MKRSISTPALVTLVFITILSSVSCAWLYYERMLYKLAFELVVEEWAACEQGVPRQPEPNKEGIEL